jgi:hypothetical protein
MAYNQNMIFFMDNFEENLKNQKNQKIKNIIDVIIISPFTIYSFNFFFK